MAYTPLFGSTGFEAGSVEVIPSANRAYASISTSAHSGTYSMRVRGESGDNGYIIVDIDVSDNEVYIAAWIKPDSDDIDYLTFTVYGGGQYVGLRWDGTYWDALVGASQVASGSVQHLNQTWRHVQFHVIIDNAGTIESKIGGVDDISYSGDTYDSGSSDITKTRLFVDVETFQTSNYSYIDDWVMATGGWIGDVRFGVALVPDADTAQKDWEPSSGSVNYDMVEEVPPSDSDYVSAGSTDYKDLYTVADWSPSVGDTPQFVVDWIRAKKDTADIQALRQVIDVNGTESSGGSISLSTDFTYYGRVLANDPDTGVTWDEAGINAIKVGQVYD